METYYYHYEKIQQFDRVALTILLIDLHLGRSKNDEKERKISHSK